MNTLLKLYLLRNLRKSESGFALVIAIVIGLILVGGGIMMISLSQEDQSKAVSLKARSDGLMGTQAGLAQVQEYLNTVRVMAKYHSHYKTDPTCDPKNKNTTCTPCNFENAGDNCWKSASVTSSGGTGLTDLQKELNALNASASCTNDPTVISRALDNMQGILKLEKQPISEDGNNKLFLYYRIEDYVYHKINDPSALDLTRHIGTGILTLTGLSSRRAWSANASTDNSESQNRLVVSLPVLASYPVAFERTTAPALWIQEGGIEDREQTTGITLSNANYNKGSQFTGDVVMSDPNAFAENSNVLRSKIECYINKDKIVQSEPKLQPLYRAQFFPADEKDRSKPALPFPALPTISPNVSSSQKNLAREKLIVSGNEDISNNAEKSGKTGNVDLIFPRKTDTKTKRTINGNEIEFYEYEFDNLKLQGNDKITIDSSNGARVIFFVKGDIELDGNSTIQHICGSGKDCDPASFQVIASETTDPARELCLPLKNNEKLAAFIFAPDYHLGLKGNAQVIGAMWGKSWGEIDGCKGNNNTVAIVQGAAWDDLVVNRPSPLEELPKIGRIMAWCEEAIDTKDDKCVPTIIRPIGGQQSPSPSPTNSGSPL